MKNLIALCIIIAIVAVPLHAVDKNPEKMTQDTQDKISVQPKDTEKKPANNEPSTITWFKFDEGFKQAAEEQKNVFVEFTADWCGWCKRMHATTFKDPQVIKMMNDNFIVVSVDGESGDSLNIDGWMTTEKRLTREYRVTGYPTYLFMTPQREVITPLKGYQQASKLYDALDYLKDDTYKTVKFEEFLKQRAEKK